MSRIPRDVRLALRSLGRNQAMTAVALLSLALGIGANTAIFSLLNAVVLRPLPVPHPEQIVALSTTIAEDPNHDQDFTWPMFLELSRQTEIFSDVFCWDGGSVSNFEVDGSRFASTLAQVSGTYYQATQVAPLLGRFITSGDASLNAHSAAVAVISYRTWRTRFHAGSDVIGKTIRVDNHPFTLIGVEPEGFSDLSPDGRSDITVPFFSPGTSATRDPYHLGFGIFARLKAGITVAQANSAVQSMWPRIQAATMPPDYAGESQTRFYARKIKLASAATGVSYLRKRFAYPLQILMAIVGAVLFIACLNIANLSLAKAAAHRHQSGVQAALGASTWDLLRPALVESLLLSFGGALLGLLIAFWASRLILSVAWTGSFATAINPSPDLKVLAFTALVATLTGILFGIVPAIYAARIDPIDALRQQSRSVRGGANLFGKGLLIVQIGLSLVLMLGALLFGRTLSALHNVDVGYRRDHLLTLVLFPQAGSVAPASRVEYYRQLAEKVNSLPGVEGVSYSEVGPANEFEYFVQTFGSLTGAPASSVEEFVGPRFFSVAGMHVLSGRQFEWSDVGHDKAIISQSLAQRLYGMQNPIGQTIYRGPHSHAYALTIVGVVNSASLWKVESHEPLALYRLFEPGADADEPIMDVRTTIDPRNLKSGIENVIRSMGRHYSLRTMTVDERLDSYITVQRLTALLSEFFAGVALLIACIGLYGLMSFHVTRRTNELGIRSALGAARRALLFMVLREALLLAGTGCLLGLGTSLVAGKFLRSILFGVIPNDPVSLAIAALAMLTVAMAAAFLPARRAAQIDPLTALRSE